MYESQPHFFGTGGVPCRDTHKWKQVCMIAKKKEEKGHIVLEQVDLIYIARYEFFRSQKAYNDFKWELA